MLNIALVFFVVVGGITFYHGEQWEGNPLYCDQFMAEELTYSRATGPWIAVTVEWYEQGKVQCGDWFIVFFSDGSRLMARALDAGYLSSAVIWDTGLPVVIDVPGLWRDGQKTATGSAVNISKAFRDGVPWREVRKTIIELSQTY